MDTEKKLLLKAFTNEKDHLQNILDSTNIAINEKSAKLSEENRNKGNELFTQKNRDAETYIEIFEYYCRSIAFAPSGTEILAKAYANRSAFLLYMNKFEECIRDADRALDITKSDVLKIMLLCRKVECMKKLCSLDYQNLLETAECYSKKVDSNNKDRVDKVINKAKICPVGNVKVSRNEPDKNVNLSQIDQILDCISIEHNEKYGRHLIAKKDYKPGDFIFREDLYATILKPNMYYTNCNYCLKICWSGIPCDNCSWALFCSEDCKNKAWDTFHDVECSVISYLKQHRLEYLEHITVSARLLLTGIHEAGAIDKLKEDLKAVDRCPDSRYKGFYKDGQFKNSTIQSVYSLNSSTSKFIPCVLAKNACETLIAIVKHGKLINNIKVDKINDITSNEDLVFLGSLLIKLACISETNIFLFSQMDCDCQRLKRTDYKCCDRGTGIATLASLLNHSCNPNAARIFTEDRKINIFALLPIEKGSQIFVTYVDFYYRKSSEDRQKLLRAYNFTCQCEACIGSWPSFFLFPHDKLAAEQSPVERKMDDSCKYIFDAVIAKKTDFNEKDVQKVCKTMIKANNCLTEPTYLMASLEDSLVNIYSRIYGWKSPIHAFKKCKNV